MFVLCLNGSVLVEHALGGKKAGIHVGAGVNARVHRGKNAVVARNDIDQLLLHIANLVKENHADLDIQAIGLRLFLNLFQESLGLVINILLCGSARLIKDKTQHPPAQPRACLGTKA